MGRGGLRRNDHFSFIRIWIYNCSLNNSFVILLTSNILVTCGFALFMDNEALALIRPAQLVILSGWYTVWDLISVLKFHRNDISYWWLIFNNWYQRPQPHNCSYTVLKYTPCKWMFMYPTAVLKRDTRHWSSVGQTTGVHWQVLW